MTDMVSGEVEPLGRLSWAEVVERLEGATCVWQDLAGLQRGPAPTDPPLATHLWAWRENHSFRFRVDGDSCIGARLTLSPGAGKDLAVIRPRSTPDPGLSEFLGELAQEVRLVVAGDQSQALFLTAAGDGV